LKNDGGIPASLLAYSKKSEAASSARPCHFVAIFFQTGIF
jgi:hypothetical protein